MKVKRILAFSMLLVLGLSIFSEFPLKSSFSFSASAAQQNASANNQAAQTMSKAARASLKKAQKKFGQSKKNIGLAFIGYVTHQTPKKQLIKYVKKSKLAAVYPFLSEVPAKNYVSTGGAELYAIVPQNKKVSFTLYKSKVSNRGTYVNAKKPFYVGKPGEIIILCCNPSEIFSDVLIVAKKGDKKLSFRPVISLKDGKLVKSKKYYDFTYYKNPNAVSKRDAKIGYEVLCETQEVKYYQKQGMTLVCLNKRRNINGSPSILYAIGKKKDGKFKAIRYYGVCDNIIFAYNPQNKSWDILTRG